MVDDMAATKNIIDLSWKGWSHLLGSRRRAAVVCSYRDYLKLYHYLPYDKGNRDSYVFLMRGLVE